MGSLTKQRGFSHLGTQQKYSFTRGPRAHSGSVEQKQSLPQEQGRLHPGSVPSRSLVPGEAPIPVPLLPANAHFTPAGLWLRHFQLLQDLLWAQGGTKSAEEPPAALLTALDLIGECATATQALLLLPAKRGIYIRFVSNFSVSEQEQRELRSCFLTRV